MLQDSQFVQMVKEVEELIEKKYNINLAIEEIYRRYDLTAAWYRARKIKTLKNSDIIDNIIFNKNKWGE